MSDVNVLTPGGVLSLRSYGSARASPAETKIADLRAATAEVANAALQEQR